MLKILLFLCLLLNSRANCPSKQKFIRSLPEDYDARLLYPGLDLKEGFSICDLESPTGQKILVEREAGKLLWFENDLLKEEIPVTTGDTSIFDKSREGDMATPIGVFYITHRNPASSFHLSLGLSYPTPEDASRGLREKLIDLKQFMEIRQAHEKRVQPPQNTELGSWIMLHGEPNRAPSSLTPLWLKRRLVTARNWTRGCVGMTNEDIQKLYQVLTPGSTVVILP